MHTKSLLYLSVSSLLVLYACQLQTDATEMEKKELEMLEKAQPEVYEVEGKKKESYYNSSREGLIEWVLKDTATLSYPFTRSIENGYVKIITSADKRLRIYSWEKDESGPMTFWGNLIQYRSGADVKAIQQSLDTYLHPDGEHNETDFGSIVDTIYTLPCTDGSTLYLADDYFRERSNYATSALVGMRIKEGNLVSAPCFVRNGKRTDTVGFEHTIADWYFITMGEGWDWLFRYDEKTQNLYVATTDEMDCITDQYDIYHFDGTDFVYQQTSGPDWLYPPLRTFQRLESLFKTKTYMIRIDNLDGETMRYASWKREKQMSDKPDLVLTGKFVEEDRSFVFSEGSYRYIVNQASNTLKVQHNGKTILEQKQEEPHL